MVRPLVALVLRQLLAIVGIRQEAGPCPSTNTGVRTADTPRRGAPAHGGAGRVAFLLGLRRRPPRASILDLRSCGRRGFQLRFVRLRRSHLSALSRSLDGCPARLARYCLCSSTA